MNYDHFKSECPNYLQLTLYCSSLTEYLLILSLSKQYFLSESLYL